MLITNQNNFANVPYPSPSYPKATVKSGGCGACSVLNCVENMTELRFKMADWIAYVIKNGGRIDGGTSISAVLKALERDYGFGYKATNSVSEVKAHLQSGGMAVFHAGGACGSWKGLLSSSGHYVCLAGMSGSNAIIIDSGWYKGKYSGTWRKHRIVKDYQNSVITVSFANLEKDKKYRSNSGNNYYLITAPGAAKSEDEEMVYKTINDVPEWGKAAVQRRVDAKLTDGTNLTESMVRVWVIADREDPIYNDLQDVPDYWLEEAKAMVAAGVITGDGVHQIAKKRSVLEAAVIAWRIKRIL